MKSFFRKIRHKKIIKKLVIPENALILDTSCQDGGFLKTLLEIHSDKHIKVCGVDMNVQDVEKARRLIPDGIFEITDNTSLPFSDEKFDIVISSLTLHHMSDPVSSIGEMERVLKDDGTVYVVDIIGENIIVNFILKCIPCPEPYHFEKFYSLQEINDLLVKTSLKLSTKFSMVVFPTFSIFSPVIILGLKKK